MRGDTMRHHGLTGARLLSSIERHNAFPDDPVQYRGGWALDAMDVGLVSFVLAALIAEWSLTGEQASWIASAGFVGMAIGATLGGLLADRFGRRSVFAVTLLIYGLATGASALVGSLLVLSGVPAYFFWRRGGASAAHAPADRPTR